MEQARIRVDDGITTVIDPAVLATASFGIAGFLIVALLLVLVVDYSRTQLAFDFARHIMQGYNSFSGAISSVRFGAGVADLLNAPDQKLTKQDPTSQHSSPSTLTGDNDSFVKKRKPRKAASGLANGSPARRNMHFGVSPPPMPPRPAKKKKKRRLYHKGRKALGLSPMSSSDLNPNMSAEGVGMVETL
jgi:hypothetical protein